MKKYDLVIVGAGPAGLMAACKAGEAGLSVLVLEKMKQAGTKLLITGNGRCNITNTANLSDFIKHINPDGRLLRQAFSQFFSKDIITFLKHCGVETKEEENGKVYPVSNSAKDVLDAFINSALKHDVEIRYNSQVVDLLVEGTTLIGIKLLTDTKESVVFASHFILCTGGKSYPSTGSTGDGYALAAKAGHTIVRPRPSLVPLVTAGDKAQSLQGLSLSAVRASLWIEQKKNSHYTGELLFTHYGLSGPLAHTLSRAAVEALDKGIKVEVSIDLVPQSDEVTFDKQLLNSLNENGKKQIDNLLKLWLPAKLIPLFLSECGIEGDKECHQVNAAERRKIRILMKDLRFIIIGHRTFKEAIITAGGISTDEINGKTMQSRLINNLYFAGEIIDVDGDTGGYNLQIAYSTGWLAAQACVGKESLKIKEEK